jgi:hypothetical protein
MHKNRCALVVATPDHAMYEQICLWGWVVMNMRHLVDATDALVRVVPESLRTTL